MNGHKKRTLSPLPEVLKPREEKDPALAKATLPPLVEQTDILGRGIFANDHFAFLSATLRMNRERHTIALDVDQKGTLVGVGSGTVQRIKREMEAAGPFENA